MPAAGAGATTSDAAPAPAAGGPVAYVPSAPVANGPAGYVPPTVAGAGVNGAAAPPVRGSAAPAPGAGSPHTRPMAQDRPLPNDLGDVLTPVSYARQEAAPRRAATVTGAPRQAAAPAPRTRWHAVLVVATVLMAAGVSVILPVAGTVAALALFAGLRTAGLVQRRNAARRTARGARTMDPVVTVVTLPWCVLRALFAMVLLAPFALAAAGLAAGITVAVAPHDWPYRALAYAAGALVLCYGLGPGSGMPRAQLRRVFGAIAKTRTTQLVAVLGITALALAAITAAVSSPSVYWPTVVPGSVVRFGVTHLGPIRRLAYLVHLGGAPRLGLPRGGFLHGVLLHSGILRHFQ